MLSRHRRLAPLLLCTATLLTAVPAVAQEVPGGEALAPLFWASMVLALLITYIYWAWTTQVIARKTQTPRGWLAWIPLGNFILWTHIACKPWWWGLLCLVPFVNLVFMALIWMAIAKARQKREWWGILMAVPMVQHIVPGYLAWSK
jgi:hypothetical protein